MPELEGLTKFASGANIIGDVFAKPVASAVGLGVGIAQRRQSKRLAGQAER